MAPTIILIVLVGQILFAVIGGLVWLRQTSKLGDDLLERGLMKVVRRDTTASKAALRRVSHLLSSHEQQLVETRAGGTLAGSSGRLSQHLHNEVRTLDGLLEVYDDLYREERERLREYAGDWQTLEELPAGPGGEGHSTAELKRLAADLLERNAELQATVLRCEQEISELIISVVRAQRETRMDRLTRLPNRRAWEDRQRVLLRERQAMGIGMLDINGLGQFNREHGRSAGDAMLQVVAKILRETPQASVYRRGDDKFVLAIPCRVSEEAVKRAEQVCARVAQASVSHGGTRLCVTVTCGVAHGADGDDFEQVCRCAEEAWEEAKQAGVAFGFKGRSV